MISAREQDNLRSQETSTEFSVSTGGPLPANLVPKLSHLCVSICAVLEKSNAVEYEIRTLIRSCM